MPRFSAPDALAVLKASVQAELPFIICSGSIGEESAVASLKAGAADFIIKDNLARLVPAIERELGEAKMRRERREALAALEQAIRARDDFLSIASHELKTPLTTLRLQVAGLLRVAESAHMKLTEDKVRSRLGSIGRSADRLANLVDRMLDVTRITTGHLELAREAVDLVALVREVVADLEPGLGESGSRIELQTDGPVVGSWDRQRIEAVVTNLLTKRDQVRGGPAGRDRGRGASARARGSWSWITASGSRRWTSAASSSGSSARCRSSTSVGLASGCGCRARSWRRTGGASRWRAGRGRDRASRSSCRSEAGGGWGYGSLGEDGRSRAGGGFGRGGSLGSLGGLAVG